MSHPLIKEASRPGEASNIENNDKFQGDRILSADFSTTKSACADNHSPHNAPTSKPSFYLIEPVPGDSGALFGFKEDLKKKFECEFVATVRDKGQICPEHRLEEVEAFLKSKGVEFSCRAIDVESSKEGRLAQTEWNRIDGLEIKRQELQEKITLAKYQSEKNGGQVNESAPEEYQEIKALEEELTGLEKEIQQRRNTAQHLESKAESSYSHMQNWETPLSFQTDLFPVPALDPLLLPEPLRLYAADCAYRMQCPIDFVAIPLLVVFSSLIGAGCAIRPKCLDPWPVIPNLWGGIIGPPSVLKSGALNEAMAPLGFLETAEDKKYETALQEKEIDDLENDIRRDKLKSELKEAVKSEDEGKIGFCKTALLQLESHKKPICCRRFKTNDTTIEKLAEIQKENPRGLLVFRDELVGFLASFDKNGREGDRSFYLEGWNGHSSSPVKTDRISRGTISSNPDRYPQV